MSAENAESKVLFAAYRAAPPKKGHRTLMLAAAAALAALLVWIIRPSPQVHRVVTKKGIKHLKDGMTQRDVGRVLGAPLLSSRSGDADCYAYGTPSLTVPSFTLYETCFEGGKLVRFKEKQYTASELNPEALPRPGDAAAPVEPEPEPAPE